MPEPEAPGTIPLTVYFLALAAILIALGFIIESCDTEKVEICDTTTGQCDFVSSCRPLIFGLIP
ncbi:MAG TPA: hypothetical protein VGB97_03900 [Candidatus Paceibacterota bacterium]|jgi:hypothetical protein